MDGNDFVALAARLSNQQGEAELRSAVSRAYYGAFHVAKSLFQDVCRIHISSGPAGHGEVIRLLSQLSTTDGRTASSKLGSLRTARNTADLQAR